MKQRRKEAKRRLVAASALAAVAVAVPTVITTTRAPADQAAAATKAAPATSAAMSKKAAALAQDRATFQRAAENGMRAINARWWDRRYGWYDERAGGPGRTPLVTLWSATGIFQTANALAIANPTKANKAAAAKIAAGARRYYNTALQPLPGYAAYPGDRGARSTTWYDDNGWWGLHFLDAMEATGDRSYLTDARRAARFIRSGWAAERGGGVWWNTDRTFRASESVATGALLAARLYEITKVKTYFYDARRFITWADKSMWNARASLYARTPAGDVDRDADVPMGYVEAPMALAHFVLCKATNDQSWCAKGQKLRAALDKWFGTYANHGPQFDHEYMRWMLELYRRTGDRRAYDVVWANGKRALASARDGQGVYSRMWDGRQIDGDDGQPGVLRPHAATTALFAWLAAVKPPTS